MSHPQRHLLVSHPGHNAIYFDATCNSRTLEIKHSDIQMHLAGRPCGMTQQNFFSFQCPECDNGLIFRVFFCF